MLKLNDSGISPPTLGGTESSPFMLQYKRTNGNVLNSKKLLEAPYRTIKGHEKIIQPLSCYIHPVRLRRAVGDACGYGD